MNEEMPKAKRPQTFLYRNDCRDGRLFDLEDAENRSEELAEDGWLKTPAKLEPLKIKKVEVTAEEIKTMSPSQIVKKVKDMGFHVFNDIELASKIGQSKALTDEQLIEMLKSRNIVYKPSKEELIEFAAGYGMVVSEEPLINRFIPSPKSLTKEELIVLGADYGLKLKMTMKEDTMIGYIAQAIEDSKVAVGS